MEPNIKSFNTESDRYLSSRPKYPFEIYSFISESCAGHNIAWDCACGSGQVAIDLINYFNRVEATDISENQLENTYRHKKINYSVQKSEETNFPGSYFDAICVAEALHWFDIEKFFNEAKRTLRPNGLFACWGYGYFKVEKKIDEIVLNVLIKEIEPYLSDGNMLLLGKYKDVRFPFNKLESPEFDMGCRWSREQLINYVLTWSPVKIYISKFGDFMIDELRKQLNKYWNRDEVRTVKMDFTFYAGHLLSK